MAVSLVSYKHLSAYVVLVLLLGLARSQQNCSEIISCSACIGSAGCIWCFDASYPSILPRCDSIDNNFSDQCPQGSVENPANVYTPVPLELNSQNQVSLESVNLTLKVGSPETFTVSVQAAENFPLDLYLLMDLSGSFADDLTTVQTIAPSLFASLTDVTSQFRVGFGSFVDKPTPPYSSLTQLRMCDGASDGCSAPFSFEHLAPFTNNEAEFTAAIEEVVISATADDPEGTLDAVLQATVCTEAIGWNQDARKVLLVITDDLMHLAGDGSLAGINKPNDAVCRTSLDPDTQRTLYTASLEYDYPSVEQVRLALFDFDIVPVLAIAPLTFETKRVVITDIAKEIGAVTVNLEGMSENLVQAVRDAYDLIVNTALLSYDAPDFLTVDVVPSCPSGSMQEELACVGIGDSVVDFAVTVTLKECTAEVMNGNSHTLVVNVRGFDRFNITVSGLCMCDCARESEVDFNSTLCLGRGDYVCGVCECQDPFMGTMCDCDPTQMCPIVAELECAGSTRGTCNECGECECNVLPNGERFTGTACECSNFGCDCSQRGSCTSCANGTEICDCDEGFFGDNCECTYDVCIDPAGASGVLCSGNGECEPCPPREGCICNEQTHVGTYCGVEVAANPGCMGVDTCVTCVGDAALQGVEVESIAGCENVGTTCADYIAIDPVDNPDEYEVEGTIGSSIECPLSTIQCQYTYFQGISETTGQPVYEVQPPDCLLIPWWAIPIIIILGLFLLGVIILVVAQIILRYLDYRELKHFEKEVQEADFTKNVNPVYQAPTMTYDNPLHGKPI